MPYEYEKEKPGLFREENQKMLFQIRDNCKSLTSKAGCFMAQAAWEGCTGSSWILLAALDYLVEIGEIKRVPQEGCAGQHQIFYSPSALRF